MAPKLQCCRCSRELEDRDLQVCRKCSRRVCYDCYEEHLKSCRYEPLKESEGTARPALLASDFGVVVASDREKKRLGLR